MADKKPKPLLRKDLTLSDIRFIVHETDDKGSKKTRELTKDEILALAPDKPREKILSDLKKKSREIEKKLREREDADRTQGLR